MSESTQVSSPKATRDAWYRMCNSAVHTECFFIVAGALCGLPAYVLAAQVVNGMGVRRGIYAFIAGGLLSGFLGALSAYCGARTRMNLAMLADEAFGVIGGRIVKR